MLARLLELFDKDGKIDLFLSHSKILPIPFEELQAFSKCARGLKTPHKVLEIAFYHDSWGNLGFTQIVPATEWSRGLWPWWVLVKGA